MVVVGGADFVTEFFSGPSVFCDPAGGGGCGIDGTGSRAGGSAEVVVEGADEDGAGPRHGGAGRRTEEFSGIVAPLEILHFSGAAGLDPGGEASGRECAFGR